MNSLRLFAILCITAFLGCDARQPKKFSQAEDWERYSALPLATATHDADLRAEIARVVAEGGTPAQLAGLTTDPTIPHERRPVHPAIAGLQATFPAEIRDKLAQRLRSVYPNARFQFAPLIRGTARELLLSADERRGNFQRLMLSQSLTPAYPHELGVGADMGYLSAVEVGNRLTGLQIAELLEAERVHEAVDSLDVMFRGIEWLVQEKHPIPRVDGARKRKEAIIVLAAIARHPKATPEIYSRLLGLIERQFAHWPPDANAWIGERAEALHTYELVRDGYLLSLLPFENLRKLRDDIGVDKLGGLVAANLDADESYFLSTMRQVIAACEQPFYQRASLFQHIQEELERLRNSDHYPFVADQLLLSELATRQEIVARDRARCLAWQIALSVAAGSDPPAESINPFTGRPFSIIRVADSVSVDDIGDGEPAIELPRIRVARR